MARMLITGGTGSLGHRLVARALAAGHTVHATHVSPRPTARPGTRLGAAAPADPIGGQADGTGGEAEWIRLDIRDRDAVRDAIVAASPDAVIHTAAGRDRNDWPSTADGAANVAAACGPAVRLVHVSTDAVFSGRAGREYTERDTPDPIYPYGAAKAAAETAVRAIAAGAAIVRTSLILGDGNGAHELLTHDLASGRADGVLFTNEIRKPVHVDDLADALLELAEDGYAGVLNVAGADAVSRYELGLLVAQRDGLDPARLRAATTEGRPGDVRLDITRAAATLRTRLRGAHEFMLPASNPPAAAPPEPGRR
ncbi:sugar nucleotide-binding protein [Dactylosporangium sp. CA-233914]|uniref:sugar nucleotide-binding protein n=1 Tax=Dactylosporangium sp. CA-233914 TaxID=3239934 RepID=UPI003D94B198